MDLKLEGFEAFLALKRKPTNSSRIQINWRLLQESPGGVDERAAGLIIRRKFALFVTVERVLKSLFQVWSG